MIPTVRPVRTWCSTPKSYPLTHWAVMVAKLRILRSRPSDQPNSAPHEFVLDAHEVGQHRCGSSVGQVLVEKLPEFRADFSCSSATVVIPLRSCCVYLGFTGPDLGEYMA